LHHDGIDSAGDEAQYLEAIELHLEAGEPIPVPTSDVDFVELETLV
jgi:hypothetical protein